MTEKPQFIWPIRGTFDVLLPTLLQSGPIGVLAALWEISKHNFTIMTGGTPALRYGFKNAQRDNSIVVGMDRFFK